MFKPTDFTIIVDSREQTPLNFKIKDFEIPTIEKGLPTGDYSVVGLEDHICVERKSLADLVGCVTSGRDRFERELMRMQAYPTRLLVIESTWSEIEAGKYRSKTNPQSVVGSLISWQERYNIPIMMCENHTRAGLMTARFLFSAVKRRVIEHQRFFKKID